MTHPGRTLARWMAAKDIGENALSRLSKVPQPTIHRILTGESGDPRRETLKKIARVFGRSAEDLYRDDAEPEQLNLDERAAALAAVLSDLSDDQLDIIVRTAQEFRRNARPGRRE